MEPDVGGVAKNELGGQERTEFLIDLTHDLLIKLA